MTDRVLKNIIGKAGGPEGMQGFDELDEGAQVGAASLPGMLACQPWRRNRTWNATRRAARPCTEVLQ